MVKLALYGILIIGACVFGHGFYTNYHRLMNTTVDDEETVGSQQKATLIKKGSSSGKFSRVVFFGGGLFFTVVTLGLMGGHEFSNFMGQRFGHLLYNDEGEAFKVSDYEQAEQKWADGQHLEAIQMMREYYKEHPNELHVAIRIAEIYEKDLQNPLAAALEYEEVLNHKLPSEQWGWTAIHLANLYNSKLNKGPKAIELLKRIVEEHPDTPAAEKARKHLALDETKAETEEEPAEEKTAPVAEVKAEPMVPQAPKNDLQDFINKFHQNKGHSDNDEAS